MSFVIEDGVPVPAASRFNPGGARPGAGRKAKYPFAKLGVGQSFLVLLDETRPKWTLRATLANSARQWGVRHGGKFVVRKVDDGFRVWRVA